MKIKRDCSGFLLGSSFSFFLFVWFIFSSFPLAAAVKNNLGDSRSTDLVGVWSGAGVWLRNSQTGAWQNISSDVARQVVCGDLDGDALEDVLGWWDTPDGIWLRHGVNHSWEKLLDSANLVWLAAGDLNGDGRDDLAGSWTHGVWWRNSQTGVWACIHNTAAEIIAVGDLDGDGWDDLVGAWSPAGVWVRYSQSGIWLKMMDMDNLIYLSLGDMNGDGRVDLLGSWTHGVWYRDSQTGAWVRLFDSAEQVAAGDLDGDGMADLLGVWPGIPGAWVRYSLDGHWECAHPVSPTWLTMGKFRNTTPLPVTQQLSCAYQTSSEDTHSYTGVITLANPNTSYQWNGEFFVIRNIQFQTTSTITRLDFETGGSVSFSVQGSQVMMDLAYNRFFPLGQTLKLVIQARKGGSQVYPGQFVPHYLRGEDIIYPQPQGLPAGWQPQKVNLTAGDLIADEQQYYQLNLNPVQQHMILYQASHPTQLQIGLAPHIDFTVNGATDLKIWVNTPFLAMGQAFAQEEFGLNPNYLCALCTKENWGAGVTQQAGGVLVPIAGQNWYWPINFNTPDGPFQIETGNFSDFADMFSDYFPPGPVHESYTMVTSDLADPRWVTCAVAAAISLITTREELLAVPDFKYNEFISSAKDSWAEQTILTFAYNRGLGSLCAKKLFRDNRQAALAATDICSAFDMGGVASHIPSVAAITLAMNNETGSVYDAMLTWEQIQVFFRALKSFYSRGFPTDDDWSLMLTDVSRAFDVLKLHWGGNAISLRYDFLTLLRVARYYLPKAYPPRPTGQNWYWQVNGIAESGC